MQLDNEGLWIDPGKIGPDYGQFDPWVWRTGSGSISDEHAQDGSMQPGDKVIDQLPPPFLLPQAEREALPPAGVEMPPRPSGPRRDR
jgi:hypothetical protein